ncbi:MAG TPA: zinc ribbon domain-containing protein [Candidatus Bathyarchaeia archaeon]|nr:zinc ribbon domain-containing protein [Candidatus Bathyarchaeia archaeon]
MKKCPGCGSIGPDEESTCGVCGENLSTVSPMTESVEQVELEDEFKRRVAERQLTRQMRKKGVVKVLGGTAAGLAILIPGLVFFSPWSMLLIPTGLTVTVTAIFGNLGRRSWSFRQGRRLMIEEEEDKERIEREQ